MTEEDLANKIRLKVSAEQDDQSADAHQGVDVGPLAKVPGTDGDLAGKVAEGQGGYSADQISHRVDPRWPIVTLSCLLAVFCLSSIIPSIDRNILAISLFTTAMVALIVEVLAMVGVVSKKFSPERLREIFFARPFYWSYTVLPCAVLFVALVFVVLKMLPPSIVHSLRSVLGLP